ncbi:dockerin, partial [Paraburkholderia sp. SIMBA_050]
GMTGWSDTSKTIQLSDDGGSTWREIEAGMPHTGTASGGCAGWVEGVTIDPANRDHVMHVHGGGICETMNASSPTPTWSPKVDNL